MAHMAFNGHPYSSLVIDLFERLPFAGRMELGPSVFTGAGGERVQGAEVQYWLKCSAGRIQAISFQAYGCPHTIAAAAWVAQHARGMTVNDVEHARWLKAERALELPPEKRGRLLIVEDALRAAAKAAAQNV
jgi:NifU-like protein involved in Fe-S cluster formation